MYKFRSVKVNGAMTDGQSIELELNLFVLILPKLPISPQSHKRKLP